MEDEFEAFLRCGRLERGRDNRSAIQEVEAEFGLLVIRVARLTHPIAMLEAEGRDPQHLAALRAYGDRYGIRALRPRGPFTLCC